MNDDNIDENQNKIDDLNNDGIYDEEELKEINVNTKKGEIETDKINNNKNFNINNEEYGSNDKEEYSNHNTSSHINQEIDNPCYWWMVNKMVESEMISDQYDHKVTSEIKKKILLFLESKDVNSLFIKFNEYSRELEGGFRLHDVHVHGDSIFNFCFFLKKDQKLAINIYRIEILVIYDYVYGNINKFLLTKMNSTLVPYVLALKWPEGIKRDLINNMHKFMMSLSQAFYSDQKQIILYIPQENISNNDQAMKDKDLINRLEIIMIEWTNQIRDFVTNQETVTNREDFHVINEIEFWELRNANLSHISVQLENKELYDIIEILKEKKENSDNLRAFISIKDSILEEKRRAEEILKFVKILKEPCIQLTKAEIKDTPGILNKIMDKIRVISEYCNSYDSTEKVSELIKKVSIQLLHKFSEKIQENMKLITLSYSDKLHYNLKLIKGCINEWKRIYSNVSQRVKLLEKNEQLKKRWNFESKDYQNIFYDLESFEKRCENLEDICLCQLQFGKNKDDIQPVFGGTKRYEIIKQLKDIEEKFDDHMKNLFHEKSNVLDIKITKWQEDYRFFSKHIEDLEDMYKNTISSAFKRVNTVEEAVNYVENFYSLARREKIKNYIKMDIALEVVNLFTMEINNMNIKNETKAFFRLQRQTTEGGNAMWSKYLMLRMEDYSKCLARMNMIFNPKKPKEEHPYMKITKKMDDLKQKMKQLEVNVKVYLQGEYQLLKDELEIEMKITDAVLDDKLKIPLIVKYEGEKQFFTLYKCNYPIDLLNLYQINNCLSRFEEYSIPPDIVKKIMDLDERTRPLRELVMQMVREYNNLVSSIKSPNEQAIFLEEFNRLISENIVRVQNRFWNTNGNETYLNKARNKIKEVSEKIFQFKQSTQTIYDICEMISKKSFFMLEKNNDIYEKYQFELEQKKVRESTLLFINQKAGEVLSHLISSYKFIENVDDSEIIQGFKNYIEEIADKIFNDAVEKAYVNSITTMHRTMLGADKNSNPPVFLKVNIQISSTDIKKKDKLKKYEFNPTSSELNVLISEMLQEMNKCVNNTPDIIKMFIEANENFIKKTEKKKQDDRLNRPLINNINNLVTRSGSGSINNQNTTGNNNVKNSAGIIKKDKKTVQKKLQLSNSNPNEISDKGYNINTKTITENILKFQKAEDAKKSFQSDLNSKNLNTKFNEIINKWESNERINKMMGPLQEDATKSYINDKFKGFLMEGREIKDVENFSTSLKENINEKNTFKIELLSSNDDIIPGTIDTYLFIQFDATPIKNKLIDLCENMVQYNLEYVTDKTQTELINRVNVDFTEHENKFRNEPITQDDYKHLRDDLQRYIAEKDFRYKKILAAQELVNKIIAVYQTKRSADELINEVMLLEKRKEMYERVLEEAGHMLNRARSKLSDVVSKEESSFKQTVEEMTREFLMRIPDKIIANIHEELNEVDSAERTLNEFSRSCKLLKVEEQKVQKGLKLFYDVLGLPYDENNKNLIDVEDQIGKLGIIWSLRREMSEIVRIWCNTRFYEFHLLQMEEERSRLESKLKNECKDLKNKPIYNTIKEQLRIYQEVFVVLNLLRDDAMDNQSHWEKIQTRLGIVTILNPHSHEFNFEKILELKLDFSNKDIIEECVIYAREQQKVDKNIESIKAEWKRNTLEFEFSEQLQTFKLLSNTKMNNDLEEHLTRIAAHKSTDYYVDFKDKIDNLENDLNKLLDIYHILKEVIDKWTYLKNVFSRNKDDMEQQSGLEFSNLRASNERFMQILRVINRVKIVKDCFLQKNIDHDLKRLYEEFSNIELGLNALLESKRSNFTRFYFISNEDFLELLGNSEDPKIINFHLSKLFSGIERVEIGFIKENNPPENKKIIQYVYDSLDEKIKLENYIYVTSVIETWLKELEKEMKQTLKKTFSDNFNKKNFDFGLNLKKTDDLDTYLNNHQQLNGQTLLTFTQFYWKKQVEYELNETSKNEKYEINWISIIKSLEENVNKVVNFINEKKEKISKKNRMLLYNYIIIERYLIEITDLLRENKIRSTDNYDWQKLLKFSLISENSTVNPLKTRNRIINDEKYIVVADQLNNRVNYGYEYIGNKERLVITNLTEKCFLTMITAVSCHRGSSLQGPAGTGKTETIKDLSRNLAKYLIVFNCSNKNTYSTMETIFMGLLRTGAWCCFDEFNRIEIEVLSVVRIQLNTIYDGLRSGARHIIFRKQPVDINKELAVFITMNPIYIGRTEMPDNLKTLFRHIAVNFANKQVICEIRFLADGYLKSEQLAKKLVSCLDSMEQQLSKQQHYDFSLRTVMSILNYTTTLRKSLLTNDEFLMLRISLYDMFKPKLVSEDEDLFEIIINSIFNSADLISDKKNINEISNKENILTEEIKQQISMRGYTGSPYLVSQTLQLISYMKLKHGIMLVGESMSGKTTSLKILQSLSTYKAKKRGSLLGNAANAEISDDYDFSHVHITTLFPKAIDIDELYGKQMKNELSEISYTEGLLPYHLKELCNMRRDDIKFVKWLVLDGPVDSIWIESLNTLLDETKMLSLPSGYRINLKPDVKMVFETENLFQATPATVSRVGLIFYEANKLSWFPIARNWLEKHSKDKEMYDNIAKWFDKYVYRILNDIKDLKLRYLISYHENHIISSFIKIYESFMIDIKKNDSENVESDLQNNPESNERYFDIAERLFIFSFMWALGGPLDDKDRLILDGIIRRYCSTFPPHSSIFDFGVVTEKEEWISWEDRLVPYFPPPNTAYNEIFVNTIDITRNKCLIYTLLNNNFSPIIIGGVSTGKSSIVKKMIFKTINTNNNQCFNVNLSYGISSKTLQQLVEVNFEKRNNKLFPPSNKRSICFIDDLNLPRKDEYGCQKIIEMLRQYVELEGWYLVEEYNLVNIKSMVMVTSTTVKNNYKSDISKRFLSKSVPISIINPDDSTKIKIFQTILSFYLSSFASEDIKKLSEILSQAMIGLHNSIIENENFLPTPSKCHYIFNLRDVSKIFESISKSKGNFYTREYFIKQWVHESFRNFNDRMLKEADKSELRDMVNKQLEMHLSSNLKECTMKENRDTMFVDFLADGYEEVVDFDELKRIILQKIENLYQSNSTESGSRSTSISQMVFFEQAINYICIINRILNKKTGGHGLLLGLGANGRSSYIKIACELSNYNQTSITTSKDLTLTDWIAYLKSAMIKSGSPCYFQKTALVIKEKDFFHQDIIEHLNYIISSGMVPNMFTSLDWDSIQGENTDSTIRNMSSESYMTLFQKNCLDNLKVFINLSPIGEKLRDYCRNYPTIINYTTIANFTDWPESALNEVARSFVKFNFNNDSESSLEETITIDVADILTQIHLSVFNVINKMESETKRKAYFTSTSFVFLIRTFNKYLAIKQENFVNNIRKYKLGINKIQIGKNKIDLMSLELEEKNKEEILKSKELEKLIDEINAKRKIAQEQETDLEYERIKNEKNQKFFAKNFEESKKELLESEKPMQEAKDIVEKKLNRSKLAEFRNLSAVPNEVKNVFFALMAIFNRNTTWDEVRTYLQDLKYEELLDIDKLESSVKNNLLKIQSFSKTFNMNKLYSQNQMMPDLATYIINIERYFKAKWNSDIKKKNLNEAENSMKAAMENLKFLEGKLYEIKFSIESLENEKREKEMSRKTIIDETIKIKEKLETASFLITAFQSEQSRWEILLSKNEDLLKNVLGNTILSSGIITYYGIFSSKYRNELLTNYWIPILKKKNIKYSENFDFLDFISTQREIEDWLICGLPNDTTFKENAAIIKYSLHFPLIIDPQDQAFLWIKKMVSVSQSKTVKVFTPQMNNYIRIIEDNLQSKNTVVINNISETLGMDLEELINRKRTDKSNLNLFLMTKIPNPQFYPSISSAVNIVNFLVNENGLEEQLLGEVVMIEKDETEKLIKKSKNEIFSTSKALDESEQTILASLNSADDNFLENGELIRELKSLKEVSVKSAENLKLINQNMEKILTSREEYRPLARKVSKFFFVLYSMNSINKMYEFSLDSYKELFKQSIIISREKQFSSESSEERIQSIEILHIKRLINFANKCLFEKHRLLFSLQLCLALIIANEEEFKRDLQRKGLSEKQIQQVMSSTENSSDNSGGISRDIFNMNEFQMLLQNSIDNSEVNTTKGFHKPPWINDEKAWKFIIRLENKIPDFKGIISSFTHNDVDWKKWYISKDVDKEEFLSEWESKCKGRTNVRKLLFIKALRPDMFATALRSYIYKNLGIDYNQEPLNLRKILIDEINCNKPLMIIHGSGIDPSEQVQRIWEEELKNAIDEETMENFNKETNSENNGGAYRERELMNKKTLIPTSTMTHFKEDKEKKEKKFLIFTLNQDQLVYTANDIKENSKIGGWIMLANTHLNLQSIPFLEKTLDELKDVHKDFRMIISTYPNSKYPISFLQRCEKITFEMPKGIANNMHSLFDDLSKETPFLGSDKYDKADIKNKAFSKIIYSLSMFHCILTERRKYKSYGWTSFYDFNNSDFKICFEIIRTYIMKYTNANDFPWNALQYLIAVNYGSRFTNEKDLELLKTYSRQFFNSKLLIDKNYNFCKNSDILYILPDDNRYESYKNTNTSDPYFANKSEFFMIMNYYKEEIKKLPKEDPTELFGLSFNSEISAQIQDNLELIENIRLLSPDIISSGGTSTRDDLIMKKINFALNNLPVITNLDEARDKIFLLNKNAKSDPITYVFFQEIQIYISHIAKMKSDLVAIENALKGNSILTSLLEQHIQSIYEDKIPISWLNAYISLKSFASFILDLGLRAEFFNNWITNGFTSFFNLGYFSNATGLINAIKQKFSLENRIPFYQVKMDFKVINDEDQIKMNKSGYLLKGIWIEGGQWDKKNSGLKDENIQDLYTLMPTILMTPIVSIENHNPIVRQFTGINTNLAVKHKFPVYYIPFRGDYLGKNSYIMDISLNIIKDKDSDKDDQEYHDYWIKKGTCLLLSKND